MSLRFPLLPQILQIKPCLVKLVSLVIFFQCVISYESLHLNFYFFISNLIWSEYTLTHAETVAQRWPATKETLALVFSFSFEFCEVFKNIFFNRTPLVAASHMISFCSVFQKKVSALKSVYISFSRLKFSFNLQFLFFI